MNSQQDSTTQRSSESTVPPEVFDDETWRICKEVEGLCDLGLYDEARQRAEAILTSREIEFVRGRAMHLALRQKDFAAAARHADVLLGYQQLISQGVRETIPVALHYAGRDEQAVDLFRRVVQSETNPSPTAWYGLACYALPARQHEEALQALLKCFAAGNPDWDPWGKAFLDAELAPLWDYVGQRTCTARDAIEWASHPLEAVLDRNEGNFVPRQVDYADMGSMPRRLRGLLRQCSQNTAVVDSLKIRRHPRVFRSYQQWEERICGPRVQVFAGLVRRVRETYDRHVPDMVRFCLDRKRLGTARYILRQFLRRHPDTDPASLPEFPGLEYWTDEWKELRQVSPEGFARLLDSTGERGTLRLRSAFPDLPERLRNSPTGWMWQGIEHCRDRDYGQALDAYVRVAESWPCDEAVVLNIIHCLMQLGRHEEAIAVSNHPALLVWPRLEREHVLRAILDGEPTVAPPTRGCPYFPTPSFNEMTDRFDREFLAWLKTRHAGPS